MVASAVSVIGQMRQRANMSRPRYQRPSACKSNCAGRSRGEINSVRGGQRALERVGQRGVAGACGREQRLRGHAADVDARPAERPALDQHHRGTPLPHRDRRRHRRTARPDHHQVYVVAATHRPRLLAAAPVTGRAPHWTFQCRGRSRAEGRSRADRGARAASGTTTKTLWFYETTGLLPAAPRTQSGYRDYDASALTRLAFIRRSRAAGLTLAQIREILTIRDAGSPPCLHVQQLLATRLAELDAQLADLHALQDTVAKLHDPAQAIDPSTCEADTVCRYV